HPPAGLATSFYTNPEVEDLIARANATVADAERADLYAQAARLIWEDAPWIFLWVQRFPMVHSADVTNISGLPNEKFYAIYARPADWARRALRGRWAVRGPAPAPPPSPMTTGPLRATPGHLAHGAAELTSSDP